MQRFCSRRGLTILELLISVSVFSFIFIVFASSMSSTRQEIKFSGEHFTAFFLSQKVTQDLSEEIRINPHAFAALGIENSTAAPGEITQGASVFFSNLDDASNSASQSAPGLNGVIHPNMLPLYDQVKSFRISSRASMQSSVIPAGFHNLFHTEVNFTWESKNDNGRYGTGCLFFAPHEMKVLETGLPLNQQDMETVFEMFYGIPPHSDVLRQLAKIHYVTAGFLNSPVLADSLKRIEDLKLALNTVQADDYENLYTSHWDLFKEWYSLAHGSFYSLALIEREMQDYGRVNPLPDTDQALRRTQKNAVMIFRMFCGSIDHARNHLQRLTDEDLTFQRGTVQFERVVSRLMDLFKVMTAVADRNYGGFGNVEARARFKTFLDNIRAYSDGCSPFLNRYANQELLFLDRPDLVMERYPQLKYTGRVLNDSLETFLSAMSPTVIADLGV